MQLDVGTVWRALATPGLPWVGGQAGRQTLTEVVVDSRQAKPGCLFVALPGERVDGHAFVQDAFDRGARAALVQKRVAGCCACLDTLHGMDADVMQPPPFCFLVQDTLQALQRLAAYWRMTLSTSRVVAVTGSVGKTTAKELIAAVLRQHFVTLRSPGNYNNEIGLPLALLQLQPDVAWVVQEMGMYGLGEIAHLASIARPDVGVVTNVGPVHLERLGSIERIAQAKAELVQALPAQGLAVLNGDDERVRSMSALTHARDVLYFGLGKGNDVWADEVETHGLNGLQMTWHFRDGSVRAHLPLLGRHSVYGALAAATVGLSQGLSWDEVMAGLRDPRAQMRTKVLRGVHGTTILDDTYNANPASTVAALDLLAEMNGRQVAVLGGMLELGVFEAEGHRMVGQRAAQVVSVLVTVGDLGQRIAQAALQAGMSSRAVHAVADNDAAVQVLRQTLCPGDYVLIKGSRGFAMEGIVSQLQAPEMAEDTELAARSV